MRGSIRTIVVLVFAVVVMAPAVAPAVEEPPQGGTFFDDDGDIHEGYIEAIAAEDITRGCDPPLNIHYCPARAVTRGQMAAFLTRALDLPASSVNAFVDDEESIFEADIDALAAAGITKGCNPPDNDEYCPNALVTRAQMAAFLTRALDLPASSVNAFVDDEESIFEADIDALAAAGITKGCNPPDNDEYCPNALVTRAQMASFLGRGLGLTPVTVAARPEVVPGMLWSVDLLSPDSPVDLSMGWQVAFADTGIAAAGGSSVVFYTPVEGRWEPQELVRTHPDFEEAFPLGLAASGGRVVATAYGHAPAVYVFEKVGGVWVDTRVPLPYTGGFDGSVAIDGDRIVARWGPLEFVELMWTGSGWEHCLFTIDVVEPDAGPGPIALEGDVVAFGDPYADATYAARWNGATWVVSRLPHPWDGEMFGSSVDVDGGRILVGANGASAGPGGPAGVYLYTWDGSAWRGRVVAAGDSGFGDEARLSGDTVITLGKSADSPSFWVFTDNGAAWDGYEIELASAPLLARLALRGSLGMATVPPTAFGPAAIYLFELPR